MKRPAKSYLEVLKQSGTQFSEDNCPRLSAALAYYTVFSLPPLLVITLTLIGYFYDPEQIREYISQQSQGVLGAEQIQSIVDSARESGQGGVASIIGIIGLIVGATAVVVQLQDSMNTVWHVQPDKEHGGIRRLLMKRVLSFTMILAIAFLLLVSLILSAVVSAIGQSISGNVSGDFWGPLFQGINFLVSLAVTTLLFAAMYKVLPDAEVEWNDVWTGALLTAVLFSLGKMGLGIYFAQFEPGSAYGAAGSIAVLLVWVYFSVMIFLLGAEFTQAWARFRGHRIAPSKGAVRVVRVTQPDTNPTMD